MSKDELLIVMATTFLGGFFAYAFTRAKDYFDHYVNSLIKHIDGLVKCERNLAANYMIYDRNKVLIEEYVKQLEQKLFIVPTYHPFIIDRSLCDSVKNIKIVNDYMSTINFVDHIDGTIKNFMDHYLTLKSDIIQEHYATPGNSPENLKKAAAYFCELESKTLKQLLTLMFEFRASLIESLAAIRIAYNEATSKLKRWTVFSNQQERLPEEMKELVRKQIAIINNEIATKKKLEW